MGILCGNKKNKPKVQFESSLPDGRRKSYRAASSGDDKGLLVKEVTLAYWCYEQTLLTLLQRKPIMLILAKALFKNLMYNVCMKLIFNLAKIFTKTIDIVFLLIIFMLVVLVI